MEQNNAAFGGLKKAALMWTHHPLIVQQLYRVCVRGQCFNMDRFNGFEVKVKFILLFSLHLLLDFVRFLFNFYFKDGMSSTLPLI